MSPEAERQRDLWIAKQQKASRILAEYGSLIWQSEQHFQAYLRLTEAEDNARFNGTPPAR